MKFNDKYFHFPPFLSVSWIHVMAVHYKNEMLYVHLIDGKIFTVGPIPAEIASAIFSAHAAYLEKAYPSKKSEQENQKMAIPNLQALLNSENGGEAQLKIAFGAFDSLGTALQHNASQSNAPDLPKEILTRISAIAKMFVADDAALLPKGEPHCNCFHCQIARAMHEGTTGETTEQSKEEEEPIQEEDLQFQQWKIIQIGDKMFNVINKLDVKENYNVYLGQPIGCTCGKEGCEHIVAVLKS